MAVTIEQVWLELHQMSTHGLAPIVFGGWAKEWLGVWPHGAHGDLDVLIPGDDIGRLDAFARLRDQPPGKRPHPHKRAYRCEGGIVELMLIEPSAGGFITNCYGHHQHHWQSPLGRAVRVGLHQPMVATPANIVAYERDYRRIEQAFFTAYPDLHAALVREHGDPHAPYDKFFPA